MSIWLWVYAYDCGISMNICEYDCGISMNIYEYDCSTSMNIYEYARCMIIRHVKE